MVEIVRDLAGFRAITSGWQQLGARVALVPTMGALHQGHLDLVTAGKAHANKIVASIFVNPAQFAPHEDLARYPRDEARDVELLASVGCDLLYAPNVSTIYPDGFATTVTVSGVTSMLEGQFRPHFFAGVTTVVAKLLLQAGADVAMFGEKDWQQLQVVTKMAKDLDIATQIVSVRTRREADGLAMSSRNAYLSPSDRAIAPALKRALDQICEGVSEGDVSRVVSQAKAQLLASGFRDVDYLAACHASTLEPWQEGDPLRVLGAAWLGQTRLIDNRGA